MSLWRYNRITGLWVHERSCDPAIAEQWLARFRADEPAESFLLAKHRPRKSPVS